MKPALFVEVTRACNHACTYCGEWRYTGDHSEYSVEEYRKLFRAAVDLGFPRINFTGGEPTLRRDLDVLVRCALDEVDGTSVEVHVTTNGTNVFQHRNLWTLPIHLVKVNLQSLDRNVYRSVTGHDLLNRVIDGILYLRKNGPPLILHYVLTTETIRELDGTLAFCAEHEIDMKLFQLDTSLSTHDKIYTDVGSVRKVLSGYSVRQWETTTPGMPIYKYKMRSGNTVHLVTSGQQRYNVDICGDCSYYPCDYGLYSLSVSPNGLVYPCLIRHEWGELIGLHRRQDIDSVLNRMSAVVENAMGCTSIGAGAR